MTENHSESDDWDVPRSLVEPFLRNRDALRGILDDVREKQMLGEHEAAREHLRSLAVAENNVFQVAVFTVLEMDEFYADLEDQYDQDEQSPIDELKSFGEQYRDLASELELVFAESAYSYYNPRPGVARQLRYSDSLQMPRVALELYSGEAELCELEHPPSQALVLAGSVVDAVADLLETVDKNDDDIAPQELNRTESVVQRLVGDVERVTEQLDEFEDLQAVQPESEESYQEYQDWGIY